MNRNIMLSQSCDVNSLSCSSLMIIYRWLLHVPHPLAHIMGAPLMPYQCNASLSTNQCGTKDMIFLITQVLFHLAVLIRLWYQMLDIPHNMARGSLAPLWDIRVIPATYSKKVHWYIVMLKESGRVQHHVAFVLVLVRTLNHFTLIWCRVFHLLAHITFTPYVSVVLYKLLGPNNINCQVSLVDNGPVLHQYALILLVRTSTAQFTKLPDCLSPAGTLCWDHWQPMDIFPFHRNCTRQSRERFCRRLGE